MHDVFTEIHGVYRARFAPDGRFVVSHSHANVQMLRTRWSRGLMTVQEPKPERAAARSLLARLRSLADEAMLRRLTADGLAALSIKAIAALLSLAMTVILARAMNPASFGAFAAGFSLAMAMSAVAGLGLQTGILRWRPEHEAAGAPDLAAAAERWGLNMTFAAAVIVLAAITAVGWMAGDTRLEQFAGLDALALTGAAALTAALSISAYLSSALRARGVVVGALLPREVLWRVGICIAAAFAGARANELSSSFALWLAAGLLTLLMAAQAARNGFFPGRPVGAPALGGSGPAAAWLRQSRGMWGSAVLFAISRHLEVVLVGFFLSAELTGLYFAALSTAASLALLVVAANTVASPMVARAHHGGTPGELQKILRWISLLLAAPIAAGFGIIAVFPSEIISLFDPSYAEYSGVLVILAAGMAVNALCGPTSAVLMMTGQERTNVKILAAVTTATLTLQILLIPTFGIWAAATLNALGAIAWNLWMRNVCVRRLGVDPTVLSLLCKAR